MTWSSALRSTFEGPNARYDNQADIARVLGVGRQKVQGWLRGSHPKGDIEEMLRVLEKLGIPRGRAMILISEPDPGTADVRTLLIEDHGWPEDVVVGLLGLDAAKPQAKRAALAAALGAALAVSQQRDNS